jgi:tRNA-modifying protein YgfZ
MTMSQCNAALLSDRSVVRVTGPAARSFLQGLITNDIDKAKPGGAIHSGLLTPQGKILFDFFVVPAGDGFLLELAKAKSGELAQRLGFYRLRAQVEIAEDPSFAVAASWGAPPKLPEGAIAHADPRLPALGLRVLFPANEDARNLGCALASEDEYHAHRIALGVPEGGRDYAFGDAFPHEAMFDQLAGVDFNKGCFVGQEVVSRMEHRGTARKRIVGVEGEGPLPSSGTEITAGGAPIGTLGSVSGSSGLALLRLDRAEEAKAAGQPLRAREVTVALRIPAWARLKTQAPTAAT